MANYITIPSTWKDLPIHKQKQDGPKQAERSTSSMESSQTVMIGHAPDVAAGCMCTISMR